VGGDSRGLSATRAPTLAIPEGLVKTRSRFELPEIMTPRHPPESEAVARHLDVCAAAVRQASHILFGIDRARLCILALCA
jgi:hypothetical protein